MMPIALQARAAMRDRWRSWLVFVAVVAMAGGAVLALAVGARRTEAAFPRFLAAQHAADVYVFATTSSLDPTAVRALPQVADVAAVTALHSTDTDIAAGALTDPRFGSDVNGFKLLEGRRPDPAHPDEAVIGFQLAQRLHLHAGSTITLHVPDEVAFKVVGVEAAPGEFPPRSTTSDLPMFVSPAFLSTDAGKSAAGSGDEGFEELAVRLRPGASSNDFSAAVQQLSGTFVGMEEGTDQATEMERSAHAQAVVLWLVAALVAAAGGLLLLQLLLRDGAEDAADHMALRTLGFTGNQLHGAFVVRVLAAAIVGAAGALAVAVLLSRMFPLGTVGLAEPAPGFTADGFVFGVGLPSLVVIVAALGAISSLSAARRRPTSSGSTRSRVLGLVHRTSLPLATDIGARMALDPGRGRRAVPVRATIVAATVGIGSIPVAATLSASLVHLLHPPTLYGVTYDVHVEASGSLADVTPFATALRDDPIVDRIVVASTGVPLESGDVTFGGEAIVGSPDSLASTVLEGRLPSGPDEVALGSGTINDLHTAVGETVPIAVAGVTGPLPLRVVGRVVMAPLTDTQRLGRGALLSQVALDAFVAAAPAGFPTPPPGDAFVSLRPGVDVAAGIAELRERLGDSADDAIITASDQPMDVATFGELKALPSLLALLLGVTAVLTIAHLLVSSVRRRRRDLAVLKSLGFAPRQLSAVVAWQATTVTAMALAIGLPLGIVGGRTLWTLISGWVGVVARPTVPAPSVVVLVPVALLFANLVAIGPAVSAARTRAARVLRAD
jgi:ABC-type lipoprotein release transport system permease subunit